MHVGLPGKDCRTIRTTFEQDGFLKEFTVKKGKLSSST